MPEQVANGYMRAGSRTVKGPGAPDVSSSSRALSPLLSLLGADVASRPGSSIWTPGAGTSSSEAMRALLLIRATAVCAGSLLLGCGRESPPPAPTTSAAPAASNETAAKATAPGSAEIAIGKPAPDFSAKAHDGAAIQPSALKGKHVVLYFYPKDETPGCT